MKLLAIYVEQYSPQLDITRSDALLDGGTPPHSVMDSSLPISREWYPAAIAICVVWIIAWTAWGWWSDLKAGRPWFKQR